MFYGFYFVCWLIGVMYTSFMGIFILLFICFAKLYVEKLMIETTGLISLAIKSNSVEGIEVW